MRSRIAVTLGVVATMSVFLAPSATAAVNTDGNRGQRVMGGTSYQGGETVAAARVSTGCSASIISPTWILTAKHCIPAGGNVSFSGGKANPSYGSIVAFPKANGIKLHPYADLALVNVNRSFSKFVKLGTANDVRVGATAQIVGWGNTRNAYGPNGSYVDYGGMSPVLKYGSMRIADLRVRDYFGGYGIFLTSQGAVAMGGDSGGPLMSDTGRQIGVASTSNRSSSSTYTNLTMYRDWIRQQSGV